MIRQTALGTAMLIATIAAFADPHQFKEAVERNYRLLGEIADCREGFAEATEGSTLMYGSYRAEPQMALITRATTGAMAIAWNTGVIPEALNRDTVCFVVMAGMYGQPGPGFSFRLFINEVPRFAFVTTTRERWEVAGQGGGRIAFTGVHRDKHGDLFGCLRITLPAAWLKAGEPVRIRAVGEKANHSAWFMVFQASDVIAYQKELVKNEAYCDLTFRTVNSSCAITVDAPASWLGQEAKVALGKGTVRQMRLSPHANASRAEFTVGVNEALAPLTVSLSGSVLFRLDTLFRPVNTTLVYDRKLVTLTAPESGPDGWHLACQSTYHPSLGTSLRDLSAMSSGKAVQHLIISTHQDIAWMDSPENCVRDRDEKIITPLLDLMKRDSSYHFDLEDVLCLREYLERHPEREGEIGLRINEGRLGIGASFNQPYEDLCSGEMLVRQFYAGKRWLRSRFPGVDTRTYWNPDIPGRTLQMPQVLKKAGVDYLVKSRFAQGLYSMVGPDGSGIIAYSPGHYGDFKARVEGATFEQAAGFTGATAIEWLKTTRSGSRDIPILSMSDMSGPDNYAAFLTRWHGLRAIVNDDGTIAPLSLPPIRSSRVEEYLDAVAPARAGFPVVQGERPNIWLYIHGPTHHWAISAKREADVLLPAAEIFNTVDALLRKSFTSYPQAELTAAWEAQLYPDHGWGGKNGEITDSTFRAKYESARDVAGRVLSRSLASIAARVTMKKNAGTPLFVFNALSWKRSGPVTLSTSFPPRAFTEGLSLKDAGGHAMPVHVDVRQRHPDGSIKTADVVFVARDIPPVGYTTYYLQPSAGAPKAVPRGPQSTMVLENNFYKIVLGAGGAQQIVDKELNEELFEAGRFLGGELFTMQSIGQDAGEWSEPQQPTMEGFDKLGNHATSWQRVESGAVRDIAEARYALPHAAVVQRLVLYHAIKRIDFEVSLLGWDGTRYREFRLAFPIRSEQGEVAYEVPFGILEVGKGEMKGSAGERYQQTVSRVRPRGIQHWIGLSTPRIGVTISSSVSVWDYQDPTDPATEQLLLQPVLLASRRSCHGEGPWYLQQGDHHYRFSLTSHAPGWRNGQRRGIEPNAPLIAVVDPPKTMKALLPESTSFVTVDADDLVLSTMKKCEDDGTVILRLYNTSGKPVEGQIGLFDPFVKAEETNILEDGGAVIPHKDNRVTLQLGRNAIATVKLTPEW